MEHIFDAALFTSTLRLVTPILLAALGGALCARAGIFNVGLEGFVLVGAFSAIVGNYITGSVTFAVLFACATVVVYSVLFAYVSIHLKANVIIAGIAMNFLALGLTTFGLRTIFDVKGAFYDKDMEGLPQWSISLIKDIPVVGELLSGHSPLVYLTAVLVIGLHVLLFRTVFGFRLMAVGENRTAAQALGLKVKRMQYSAVIGSGVLCALAGAQLSLGQVTLFAENMTAGRGFISLVAMMLGQSNPFGVAAASLLFGFMDALGIRLQGFSVPTQFTLMLPYVATIIAMFFFRNSSYLQSMRRESL